MTTAVLDVVTLENARSLAVAALRSEVGIIAMHNMYGLAFAFILQLPLTDPSPASVSYQGAKALAFLGAILCDSTGQEVNKFSVYAAAIAIARLAVEHGIPRALHSLANTREWIADPSGPINQVFQSAIEWAPSAYTSLSQYFLVGPIIMVNIETFCGAMRNTIVSFASNLKELLNNHINLFVLPVLCTLFVVGALLIIVRSRRTIMTGLVRVGTGKRRLLGSITSSLGKIRRGRRTTMSAAVLSGIVATSSFAMIASTGLQPYEGWLNGITTPTAYAGSILEQIFEQTMSWTGPHLGTLNEFARVVSKIPDPEYIHKWIQPRITDLFEMGQSAFKLFWPPKAPKAKYILGSEGQSCTAACAAADTTCSDSIHGDATYGEDIALDAVRLSGLPLRGKDEFRDNLRVRDGYYVNEESRRFAVPGLWKTDEGYADVTWKNPSYTQTPSRCDATWRDMRRLCACAP